MLEQYHNFTNLQQEFRRLYPGSSIDLCSGGGNLMGYESLRVSDVSQLTDSGSLLHRQLLFVLPVSSRQD